jgi:hypothetical protein
MITQERVATRQRPDLDLRPSQVSTGRSEERTDPELGSILRRLFLVGVGFAVASAGFMLMLSVFLVFIGLPMFIFGLAVMQAQER